MAHSAKSALKPARRQPVSDCRPSARAACRVAPASASSARSPKSVHAMCSISSSEVPGLVPGLQSLETAMGTPAARRAATGGTRVSFRQ